MVCLFVLVVFAVFCFFVFDVLFFGEGCCVFCSFVCLFTGFLVFVVVWGFVWLVGWLVGWLVVSFLCFLLLSLEERVLPCTHHDTCLSAVTGEQLAHGPYSHNKLCLSSDILPQCHLSSAGNRACPTL